MNKIIAALVFAVIGGLLLWRFTTYEQADNPTDKKEGVKKEQAGGGFDKDRYSLSDPNSIWVVVNKKRPLPAGYKPVDLINPDVPLRLGAGEEQMFIRREVANAVKEMFLAANKDGASGLVFGSGYRSEALQKQFYDSYAAKSGAAAADKFSARPRYSEHQTGLSFDLTSKSGKCHLEICFGDMPEGKWAAENAHKFGFIIRYPNSKVDKTGYQSEPWHLRYVGRKLAGEIKKSGQTLEEFFGLGSAAQY